jgi:hypothetical protein
MSKFYELMRYDSVCFVRERDNKDFILTPGEATRLS